MMLPCSSGEAQGSKKEGLDSNEKKKDSLFSFLKK